jgi:hydrocephalus-inducing protein
MEDNTQHFGKVFLRSKKAQTIQLSNLGDIGGKFEWDSTYYKDYFTISPKRGHISPHDL